jgi:hypothetical protein
MTTEPTPNTPPQGEPAPASQPAAANWGDPAAAAPKKGWSGKKTAIAAGIAVVIAAGGGAAIWAGTSSADNSAQQGGPGGFGGPGGPGGGQFRGQGTGGNFGGGMTALRDALHGDFVVANPNGGYTTERLQTGDVTELSATSVTLTSKDGYKQTYTLDGSTQKTGEVKTGDTNVTVVAKVDGQTATATSLGQALQQGTGQRQPGQRRSGDYSARPSN